MSTILELEQRDIELQLEEISLKRRQIEIEREQLNEENAPVSVPAPAPVSEVRPQCYLHYSNSVQENHMKIADVNPDGSILIHHGKDTVTVSKKYSMRTLLWIKNNLSSWRSMQREETNFWRKLAGKYSRRFLKGDSISHTTIEKLCYLVDSGEMDAWFEKYEMFKSVSQSTLKMNNSNGGWIQ